MNRIGQLMAKLKGIVWELDNTKMERTNICWLDELEEVVKQLKGICKHWKGREEGFERQDSKESNEVKGK